MPVTADDHVVVVRKSKRGAGRITLELPGGPVDAGEEPPAAARRER